MRIQLFFLSCLMCLFSCTTYADEVSLRKNLETFFPNAKIESLKKTPYLELYEVVVGDKLFYTDETAAYLFSGHVFDLKTEKNLTEERLQAIQNARRIDINSLPLELAIKAVRGNGQRKLVVFSDPNCGYCKRLEKELLGITNVTIYTILYPILKGSKELSKAVWCATDRLKTWNDLMLRTIPPIGVNCNAPLSKLIQIGQKHNFNSTPTLIFADGSVVLGMIPAEIIEKKLDANTQ